MNKRLISSFQSITPFLLLGLTISVLFGLLLMFSYLLIWGLFIGALLWLVAAVKQFFFPTKSHTQTRGRIIEYRDKQ